ncbi:hypothetical protein B0H10DRAFT_2167510 [Mycena sp. CBHHK59/15]|nr:hypothetical protein B0H10DRAFT_2167915 [Mycena sp. CBHHK59/15]KAJ6600166.1 hypothetical protein B0H10DRAFT_2167510 [Mycena sp. CBHHK59/15]
MPAPETAPQQRPVLGHVNLMADTLIANATLDDLRAIVRSMVASATPGIAAALTAAARDRLLQTNVTRLPSNSYQQQQCFFAPSCNSHEVAATPQLQDTLRRARALYGSGMGFASLCLLAHVIRATIGMRWNREGDVAEALAVIDADIAQAIQSCKEEVESGRVGDRGPARRALNDLRCAIQASLADVESWGGEFPFERGASSVEYWKV